MPYVRASHPRYTRNPLAHEERRRRDSDSSWVRSFACDDMRILIVGRGPVRKEAIDVFREMGVDAVGMLLSERDSIVYPRGLAPEVRLLPAEHVHPITDYTGAMSEERDARIDDIIAICERHGYGYVFAGYGFMSEDPHFVRRLEATGLRFIGPSSPVQAAAGAKDSARRTARETGASLTPGIDDLVRRALLALYPDERALGALAEVHAIPLPASVDGPVDDAPRRLADALLEGARSRRLDLLSIEEIGRQARAEAERLLEAYPGRRFRLKAIGGGGGKGQRVFSDAAEVPRLLGEVLTEVKATGPGDDKNVLIELNIDSTRHLEIQMLGNGSWCTTLGGRDCSLQMHEQKLVEVSLTRERLASEIERARSAGNDPRAAALERELGTLERMEAEAEGFGERVGLDSASTFECIVSDEGHFFMEVNTRIQVEHRVSELCYGLRFTNPEDAADRFEVHSLVEAMALIARHGARLPKPERVEREHAALEVRLNATDDALHPAAGGILEDWSDPLPDEIRDDQGISLKNPDTRSFIPYHLAGAYDSNIALLLATGDDRETSWDRVAEVLRRTRLSGRDLFTNRAFLLGIVEWFRHRDVWARPTTAFVREYLTAVGELALEARLVDVDLVLDAVERHHLESVDASGRAAVRSIRARKETLLRRPVEALLASPHLLSAWLSRHRRDMLTEGGRGSWQRNPVEVLAETYELLDLTHPEAPAAQRIWDHDRQLLELALGFYADLDAVLGAELGWPERDRMLRGGPPPRALDAERWHAVQCAHVGHQLGLEALGVLVGVGQRAGGAALAVAEDLGIEVDPSLRDPERVERAAKALAPPPRAAPNEIVAPMGGVLFNREAPDRPPFVRAGHHFEAGDTLFVIEVMKMFNRFDAPFAGTIVDVHVHENGTIVRKGQPIFEVLPDEVVEVEDPEAVARLRTRVTGELLRVVGLRPPA